MPSTENKLRYFAVVCEHEKIGYALDYYPNEKRAYKPGCFIVGDCLIIGDFATSKEALAAVRRKLKMPDDEDNNE